MVSSVVWNGDIDPEEDWVLGNKSVRTMDMA